MECSICCEKTNKSTHKVILCSFCPEKDSFHPCLTCVKRYLLETTQNAHCMNCKHEWTRVELYTKIPKVFLNGEYKQRRQELMVERERSLMPATQPYVEVAMDRREIAIMEKDIRNIFKNMLEVSIYSNEHLQFNIQKITREHEIKCLSHLIRLKERKLMNRQSNRVHFIRQCPMDGCRGFLSTAWKCGLCKVRVCSKCHEPKPDTNNENEEAVLIEEEAEAEIEVEGTTDVEGENVQNATTTTPEVIRDGVHVCDPNNIETANLLKKDTKPCPKCASMIFKISGCDQMFCTQCHTAFSWRTGTIETKVIHNPHYYQYLREQSADGEIPRNPLDNPCPDILPEGNAFNDQMMRYIDIKLRDLPIFFQENNPLPIRMLIKIRAEILLCNHIVAYHLQEEQIIQDNLSLRIRYMMHEITEEHYKQQLHIREKRLEKDREFGMIFRTYVVAVRDIILNFVNLPDKSSQIEQQRTILLELENLRRYINECFRLLLPIFNNTVWQITEKKDLLNLVRITK